MTPTDADGAEPDAHAGAVATATGDDRGGGPFTPAALTALRRDPRMRAGALVVAVVVGLGVAWLHWLGLFVAGALVGLVARSVPRAVGWGLAVGVLAVALTVATHPMNAADLLALRPPVYVTVAAGLAAPAWGSLVRGVV